MNALRAKFVAEVLAGKTLKAAYIAAGYKARDHSAEAAAERLAKEPEVAAAIAAGQHQATAAAVEQCSLSKQWILDKLRAIVTGEAVSDSSRVRALELLGNHLGMWVQRIEAEVPKFDLSNIPDKHKELLLRALRAARHDPGGP